MNNSVNAISKISWVGSWISDLLGDRKKNPGFIKANSSIIAGIALIGPIAFDAIAFYCQHREEIIPTCRRVGQTIIKNLLPPKDADQSEVLKWIAKKVGTVFLATALVVSIYALVEFGIVSSTAAYAYSILAEFRVVQLFVRAFDYETPIIVYPGYIAIGLAHLVQAKLAYDRGEKAYLAKHLYAAVLSFAAPIAMAAGITEARWHHMSYGLLSMLPSNPGLNFFGGLMATDSILYWIKPLKNNYDFSNVFVDHLGLFIAQLSCLTIFECLKRALFESEKENKKNMQSINNMC